MKSFRDLVEELQRLSDRLGSNDGGKFLDVDHHKEVYVKHYSNPDQARVEELAGKIYHAMGIKTLHPKYDNVEGKPSIVTNWDPDISTKSPDFYKNISRKHADQLGKMFHAAVLTKNWDIVGLEHDNVVHNHATNDLHAIDHGGAFHFRAMGGNKPYTDDIDEHESLMDPRFSAGQVFSSVEKQHPGTMRKAIASVKKLTPDVTEPIFRNSHLSNWKELHDTFYKRRDKLIHKYEGAALSEAI